MMLDTPRKESPIKGCLLTIVTLAAMAGACYLLCTVLFLLNQGTAETGAFLFWPFGQ
jgi:hypothetical protein